MLAARAVPVRVKTLTAFAAPDPWNDLALTGFSVEAHVLGPERPVRAPRDTGPPYILGVRSELDGETHLMPESLSELWSTGQAPAEALPRLLHGAEHSLTTGDFRFYLHARRHLWILAIFGVFALAAFLWSARQFAVRQPAAVRFQKAPVFLSAEEWLKTPMEEMRLVSTTVPTLEGSRTLSAAIQFPPGFIGGGGGQPDALAWVIAAEGRRLLLISGPFTGLVSRHRAMTGFAVRRSALSLPEPVLDELRASLPGLNTNLVMCFGWLPGIPGGVASPWFGIAMGAMPLFCGLLVFIVIRRGQARRRRQMRQFLAVLGAHP